MTEQLRVGHATQSNPIYGQYLVERVRAGSKSDRTRATIMAAACHLLDTTQIHGLTITAICRSAGISAGTFYLYFRDKTDLVSTILMGFVSFAQDTMRHAGDIETDQVRAANGSYMTMFRCNPGLMRCLMHDFATVPAARAAFQTLNRDWLGRVVAARRQKLGAQAPSSAELTRRAYALGGMVDQYLSTLYLTRDLSLAAVSEDTEAVLDTLTLIWTRGMQP